MRLADTSDLWWKTAVLYCVDVAKYLDDNGDGTGDLVGITRRVDYLEELGVTCLWLMPFYTSPKRDNGYDVADFYGVDPAVGTAGDLVELIRTARDRGIRVIVDLVVNHTSDQHPWFQNARESRDSRYRDFYVWSDEVPEDTRETMFPGVEDGVWEWDERTEQYYLHSFYRHQPDLNVANPRVREELAKVMGFWLEVGVSGFRVDAVPSFVSSPWRREPERDHDVLRTLRRFAQRRASDAMLLGEVNLPHEDQLEYFGHEGTGELHMQFDFPLNQALYLALARQNPEAVRAVLTGRPDIPATSQWANFVRNHDELSLDQLTDDEREEVFAVFAPEEDQRVFDRGIRRRLPPMLGGDPRRVRMVYSLLFSLPGTPVLFYGEEIGMGENLAVPERDAVRTPMQWTSADDAGFSSAPADDFPLPLAEGPWGPRHINVEDQLVDPDSLWSHVAHLAKTYRHSPEIGWGRLDDLDTDAEQVLAHSCTSELGRFVAVHHFGEAPVTVHVRLGGDEPEGTVLVDLADGAHVTLDDGVATFDLAAYGARRLQVRRPGDGRLR